MINLTIKVFCTCLVLICMLSFHSAHAQQWVGNNNPNDPVWRNGRVGIGISNPSRPLHLRGSNTVLQIDRDTKDPGFGVTRYSPGFGEVWKSFFFYTEGTGPNQGRFIIADWGQNVSGPSTPRLVIDNVGNIGLGTLNPASRLHLNGNAGLLNLEGKDHAYIQFFPDGFGAGRKAWLGYGEADSNILTINNQFNDAVTIRTNNTEKFRVTGEGFVGINTTNPDTELHVRGNAGLLNLEGVNHAYIQFFPDGFGAGRKAWLGYGEADSNLLTINNQFNDAVAIRTNNTEKFRVTGAGNVGIGTPNPQVKLDILNNLDWQLRLNNLADGGDGWFVGSSADAWTAGGGKFLISSDPLASNAAFIINSINNVGINNVNPRAPLHVGVDAGFNSRIAFGTAEYIEDGGDNQIIVAGRLIPREDDEYDLGRSSREWRNLFLDGSVITTSDKRAKENIKKIKSESALAKILQLDAVTFKYTGSKHKELVAGLIAQDVQKIIPEIIYDPSQDLIRNEDGVMEPAATDGEGLLGIKYTQLIPYLIAALQEQEVKIAQLQEELTTVKEQTTFDGGPGNIKEAQLFQNNPNPFDSETSIKMYLPEDANFATLYIYDMQGNQLNKIDVAGKGETAITLEAGYLNSGMYMYALIVDGKEIDTKRMIITK